MLEIEIKAYIDDFQKVQKKIEEIGAKFVNSKLEIDSYYNIQTRNFAQTDEALRIRESDECTLTYKGPKVDSSTKTREEINVKVDDANELKKIFSRLGFIFISEVRKERMKYILNDFEITLDNVSGLGNFVEVEIKGEAWELDEKRKSAFELMSKLGLHKYERKSYLELLLEKNGRKL
ncbi:MAG: class IV adenylate cyclase [Thermoplasmata archaeon]